MFLRYLILRLNSPPRSPRLGRRGPRRMIGRMTTTDHQPMLALALRLAGEAGEIALPRARQLPLARKSDDSMVTQTDKDVQEHILAGISARFPDHAVLAEESTVTIQGFPRPGAARYCWVIDPIDGTRNFITGFPCWATSIAVLDGGVPVAAAICEHNQDALYGAALGAGATLNGHPIAVRQPPPREDWLIGGPSTKEPLTTRILEKIIHTPNFIYRNVGSSAMHLCWAGCGAIAVAFAKRCKIWDIAAGALLVTEAGGVISDVGGRPVVPFDLTRHPEEDIPFVAGAPEAHRTLVELMRQTV